MRKNRLVIGLIGLSVALVLVVGVVVYRAAHRESNLDLTDDGRNPRDGGGDAAGASEDDFVIIGGVRRPRDWALRNSGGGSGEQETSLDSDVSGLTDYGTTPPVALDANPHVESVVEASREGTHPERLSPLIAPAPFDPVAFAEDPQVFLTTIEPGRVFQTAQPGEDVSALRRISPSMQRMQQGDSVFLEVQAEADAPVTFTSFDLGRFENQLPSITIQADGDGIATAEFFAPPGTINDVNILAGSPVNSGQVKFVVNVTLPVQPVPADGVSTEDGS